MSKILITGGAGFIGCNAAKRFLDQGHEVTILDDLSRHGSEKNLAWLGPKPTHYKIKLQYHHQVSALFQQVGPFDVVLHLGAQTAVTTSVTDPRLDFEVNTIGTFNMLEATRIFSPQATFIFSSTNKVYGQIEDAPATGVSETQPLDFHSPYGCSKGAADQYVRDYARIYGLNTVVLRQSCIYGPRQFGVEDQGWLAHFCIQANLGRPITIYGDGKQVRDILWIDDMLDCYQACIDRIQDVRGEVFNIGGGPKNQVNLIQALEMLGSGASQFGPVRPGDQQVYVSDISKAKVKLGWEPKVGPQEGIERLYAWVKENLALFT